MDALRVLVATHNYPRFAGDSAGAFVARLVDALAARGVECVVVTPRSAGSTSEERGCRVVRFPYARPDAERIGYSGDPAATFRSLARLRVLPSYIRAFSGTVRETVRAFRPDVIHAHWWIPAGWLAARAGAPFVLTCHGTDVRLAARHAALRWAAAPVFRRAAVVTAVSTFLAEQIGGLFPQLSGNVCVTPMGMDVAAFARDATAPKLDPPRILYAGYLVPEKGVDVLLRAFERLRRRGVACRLRVLGQGPAEPGLRALARELGVLEGIDWSPLVPHDRMPSEYAASHVTVLPSRGQAEGLGLTLVEALLAGCAVVGSPAGGIPDVIRHGVTGLLFADGDDAQLAERLEFLLTHPGEREQLSIAGAAHVRERWDLEKCVDRFLSIYVDAKNHAHS